MASEKHFTFNVFIETVEGGAYVAHCLEAGLVATSDDCDELPHKMAKMLSRQISFALRNNNPSDIFHPAPPEIWEKFFQAKGTIERTVRPMKVNDVGGFVLTQNSYAAAAC